MDPLIQSYTYFNNIILFHYYVQVNFTVCTRSTELNINQPSKRSSLFSKRMTQFAEGTAFKWVKVTDE